MVNQENPIQKRVRFAVVGAGHMGANHIKKLLSQGEKMGARVSVVVEPDDLRVQALKREFPEGKAPKFIANLGLLNSVGPEDYPEAAIIAVPATIHVETASACLAKGLHCLVEKPLGFSALDCRELQHMAAKTQKIVHVGLLERWSLCHLWKDWSPKSGPLTIHTTRSGPFVPRVADTDVIHDLMIHDIDMFTVLSSIFGLSPVVKVRAWGRKLRSSLLDTAVVALDLKDGGVIRFFASRLSAEAERKWEMTGPDWHASIDFMRRNLKRFERFKNTEHFEAHESSWPGGDALAFELEAFVRSIRKQNMDHLVPGGAACPALCQPERIIPTPESVIRTHEIIDEVLSCITILGSHA